MLHLATPHARVPRTPIRERIDWMVVVGTIVGLLMLLLAQAWLGAASNPSELTLGRSTPDLGPNPGAIWSPPP